MRHEQFPWSYEVSTLVIEGAFIDVAAAFKNFFAGPKTGKKRGYPKFKSKRRSKQAFYLANDRFEVGDHWVEISKLGRVTIAEKLRFSGKIRISHGSQKLPPGGLFPSRLNFPMKHQSHPPNHLAASMSAYIALRASAIAALGKLLRLLESKVAMLVAR